MGPNASRYVYFSSQFMVLALLACGPSATVTDEVDSADETEQAFTDGAGPLRGHEDVTRFALSLANTRLSVDTGRAVYPSLSVGESCLGTSNPVLKGNCVTDFPDATMTTTYGVSKSAWQTAGAIQDLHFLRNYVGTNGAVGARAACEGAKARVATATNLALARWKAGDVNGANYWVGHALHTIQDSFSAAHTSRTGATLQTLVDVCTYGRTVSGVCKHGAVDARDRIWRATPVCQLNPLNRSWNCMTDNAQQAAVASAGYLLVVARAAASGADITPPLNTWFTASSADGWSGFFNCDTLK